MLCPLVFSVLAASLHDLRTLGLLCRSRGIITYMQEVVIGALTFVSSSVFAHFVLSHW